MSHILPYPLTSYPVSLNPLYSKPSKGAEMP